MPPSSPEAQSGPEVNPTARRATQLPLPLGFVPYQFLDHGLREAHTHPLVGHRIETGEFRTWRLPAEKAWRESDPVRGDRVAAVGHGVRRARARLRQPRGGRARPGVRHKRGAAADTEPDDQPARLGQLARGLVPGTAGPARRQRPAEAAQELCANLGVLPRRPRRRPWVRRSPQPQPAQLGVHDMLAATRSLQPAGAGKADPAALAPAAQGNNGRGPQQLVVRGADARGWVGGDTRLRDRVVRALPQRGIRRAARGRRGGRHRQEHHHALPAPVARPGLAHGGVPRAAEGRGGAGEALHQEQHAGGLRWSAIRAS